MTERQKTVVGRIVGYFGKEKVQAYIRQFYEDADISDLTYVQAHRLICGLGVMMPIKAIGSRHLGGISA